MKLKTIYLVGIAALLLGACDTTTGDESTIGEAQTPAAEQGAVTYTVDTSASSIEWLAKKVTGQHNGTVEVRSGQLGFDGTTLKSGKIEMDMKSIRVLDMPDDAENTGKLTGHLNSPDFFNTDTFPTATFELVSATPAEGANNYNLTGNLTLKGITKSITFPAKVNVTENEVTADANFDIDRTEYDVRYGSAKLFPDIGDKAIYDNFNIKLNLRAPRTNS